MRRTVLHAAVPLALVAAVSGCGGSLPLTGGGATKTLVTGTGRQEITPLSLRRVGNKVEVTIRVRNASGQVQYADPAIMTRLDVGTAKTVDGLEGCASSPGFPLSPHLGPGDTMVGCLGFTLPAGTSPRQLQYGGRSRGLGPTGLAWDAGSIPGSAPATVDAPPVPVGRPAGTPATLTGRDYGSEPNVDAGDQSVDTRIQVTPDSLTDPAPTDRFENPALGNRVVALRLTIRNTGSHPFWALPDSELLLWDAEGHAHDGDVTVTSTAGPLFEGQLIQPGGQASGWVTCQLPQRAALTRIEYVLEYGGAGAVASWKPTRT
ncbi:MAG: DUF4352 domain-containing protein [Mycobacteriales bacterium]